MIDTENMNIPLLCQKLYKFTIEPSATVGHLKFYMQCNVISDHTIWSGISVKSYRYVTENISYTFEVPFRRQTSESLKGFDWNNDGPASQTVAQHYISIGPMYCVIWCFWRQDVKRHPIVTCMQKSENTYNHPRLFQSRASVKTVGQH